MKEKISNLAKTVYKAIKENIKNFAKLVYGIIFIVGISYCVEIYQEYIKPLPLPMHKKVLAALALGGIGVAAYLWFFKYSQE